MQVHRYVDTPGSGFVLRGIISGDRLGFKLTLRNLDIDLSESDVDTLIHMDLYMLSKINMDSMIGYYELSSIEDDLGSHFNTVVRVFYKEKFITYFARHDWHKFISSMRKALDHLRLSAVQMVLES